jgi:3-phenylpropionate/trans-cinnamate dioxygenase ferredoxin component
MNLCRLSELTDGAATYLVVEGCPFAVVRVGDDVHVIGDTCTHADVSLSEGEVDVDARTVECWKHGSAFDLRTGVPLTFPATRAVPVVSVSVVGDDVIADDESLAVALAALEGSRP